MGVYAPYEKLSGSTSAKPVLSKWDEVREMVGLRAPKNSARNGSTRRR